MYFCVCVCVSASAQMFVHCQKHCTSCCKLLKPAALGWIRISQEAGRSSLVLSWPTNGFVDLIMVTDPSAKRSGGLLIQIKCFPHLWSFIRRLMMVTDVCVCVCSEYNRKVPSVLLITYVLLDLWGTRVSGLTHKRSIRLDTTTLTSSLCSALVSSSTMYVSCWTLRLVCCRTRLHNGKKCSVMLNYRI